MNDESKLRLVREFTELPLSNKVTVVGFAAALFVAGYTAGVKYDDVIAKINGKNILSNDELVILKNQGNARSSCLSLDDLLGPKNIAIDKNELEVLNKRPTNCPTLAELIGDRNVAVRIDELATLKKRPVRCPASQCEEGDEVTESCHADSPDVIVAKFEEYEKKRNEKIFNDHYRDKWVCSWLIKIIELPERNGDGYWEVRGRFSPEKADVYSSVSVDVTLSYRSSIAGISVDDEVNVSGRITRASTYGIDLHDAQLLN